MGSGMSESNGHGKAKISDINVVQVVQPFVFRMPEIIDLIERAFKGSMVEDIDNLILELQKFIVLDYAALFIGQENLKWNALTVIMRSNLLKDPQVFHFYCSGSSKLRRKLMQESLDWIKNQGYNGFWTSNMSGRETAFKRLFKKAGEAKKIGTIYKFEVS